MRTKRQKSYDKLYYLGDIWVGNFFRDFRTWKGQWGKKEPPEFRRIYKEDILPYWKQFGVRPKKLWFRHYYDELGKVDHRYIPHNIHHRYVIPYFDNPAYERQLEDKNLYSMIFPYMKRPKTMFKYFAKTSFNNEPGSFCNDDFSPISREEAVSRLMAGGKFILKPTRDTGEGMDVKAFSADDGRDAVEALLDSYSGVDYIVQRFLVQHKSLADLNSSSLNTIRLMTLEWRGEVRLLAGIIRIGHPGSAVDNVAAGGYEVGIDLESGTLKKYGFTYAEGMGAEGIPGGPIFEGFPLPSWDKLRDTALDCALRLPHLKLIGWDFAVDENGDVVLIELNCHFSQTQESNGPTFGDQTDEILAAIFGRKN